jgi:7-cyano-7-deazaguanine reductase
VELKSLKLYIWSFRDEGKFHEAVTNEILDEIVEAVRPRFARLTAKFWVRGGIFTTVVAEHRAKGWKPADIRWMLALTAPRVHAARRQLRLAGRF